MSPLAGARGFLAVVREENLPFMAAGIAYYAIASVVPALVVALALLGVFGAADATSSLLRSSVDGNARRVLDVALTASRGRDTAGAVGLAVLVWSGSKVFRGLTVAFAEIYDEASTLALPERVLRSVAVLGVLSFTLGLLSATALVLELLQLPVALPRVVGTAVAFLGLVAALVPLYYLLPPVSVSLGHVLPGAVLTALGWVALQVLLFSYARSVGGYVTYGVLGGVLLFVAFLYLAAMVLLAGAVLNVVVDGRTHRSAA